MMDDQAQNNYNAVERKRVDEQDWENRIEA